MQPSFNDLFLEILSILKYQNRENFLKEIEKTNHIVALANCIERLPNHVREKIKADFDKQDLLKKYIPKDVYVEEMQKASTKTLLEFLQHMTPVLNDKEKEQIAAVFPN